MRVRIDAGALAAAGGPALKTAAETLGRALVELGGTLDVLVSTASATAQQPPPGRPAGRVRRTARLGRSLLRDLRTVTQQYGWFWSFGDPTRRNTPGQGT